MSINLKRVVSCQRCGQVLPTVEVEPGKFAAVQPLPVPSLAPGRMKISLAGKAHFSPAEMASKLLEQSCYALQTLPAFIPHDFVCAPEGVVPRLLADLRTMQRVESQLEAQGDQAANPLEDPSDA